MTSNSSPTQTVRGAETGQKSKGPVKAQMILAVWRHGETDTMDLAYRFRVSEPEVYSIIAHRNDTPKAKPVAAKVPFAGTPAKRKPRPLTALPTPQTIYRLTDGEEYLHESGLSTTEDKRFAWKGTADKALACIAKFPAASNMNMQVVI